MTEGPSAVLGDAADKAQDAAKKAADAAQGAAKDVQDAAGKAADDVKGAASKAADSAHDAAKDAKADASKAVEQAKAETKQAVSDSKAATKQAVADVKADTKTATDKAVADAKAAAGVKPERPVDEIRAELDQTRDRLAQRIDDLTDYVAPKNIADRQVSKVKRVFVDEYGGIKPDRVLIAAGVVVGFVVLMGLRRRRRG